MTGEPKTVDYWVRFFHQPDTYFLLLALLIAILNGSQSHLLA